MYRTVAARSLNRKNPRPLHAAIEALESRQLLAAAPTPIPVDLLAQFNTNGPAKSIDLVDNLAYSINWSTGLQIIDLTNPASPRLRGQIANPPSFAQDIQVVNNLAYVANGYNGLQIIDVSNPDAPALRGRCDTAYAIDVQVVGNRAYVADGAAGLQIIDVSNPDSPSLLGQFASIDALSVQVVDNLAYVAGGIGGLHILDISNPQTPLRLGGFDTPGYAQSLQVVGGLAYVADDAAGLQIIDITNPASPQRRGGYDTPGAARDVQVQSGLAFVADGYAGLQIIDITNPASPQLRGGFDTPGSAKKLRVANGLACVADGYGGLAVLRVGLADVGDTLPLAANLGSLSPNQLRTAQDDLGNGPNAAADVDLYAFTLTHTGTVSFDIDPAGSSPDAYLRLFDAAGQEIVANIDDLAGDPYLSVWLDAGAYFLGVTGRPNTAYDPTLSGSGLPSATTGAYNLIVRTYPLDYLNINAGLARLDGSRSFSQMTVIAPASASVIPGSSQPLQVANLQLVNNALLDLNDNTLLTTATPLADLANWIKSSSLTSSLKTDHTTLAAFSQPDASIKVKLVWYGDVNNDGAVNLNDYFIIDSNYLNQTPATPLDFSNGDVNLDNTINLNDYFLIDSAYLAQGSPLAAFALAASRIRPQARSPIASKKLRTTPARKQTPTTLFSSRKRIH